VISDKENGPEKRRPLDAYLSLDTNRLRIPLVIHYNDLHTREQLSHGTELAGHRR
jgi:hypothetical protein